MSQFRLNITPLGAAMGLFFIAMAMAIIFLPYTSIRTFAQQVPQTGGEAATSTPPTTSTTTAEVDTSTPVLSLVRTPDTTTGEVNLRLEWTTSRSSLTPAHVLKREPSQEPWSVEYSTHSLSAGDTSYDIGTESELWRLWRTGDNLEFAVRFAGSVYSNSVTLSRPSAGETATTTPPTTSTPTVEVDTSTPVLSLVRAPDTTTGEVNLRLEWTTSRSSLTPAHVLKREPSQEPWSVEYSTHSLSAGDTSYDIGTESELWRLWRTGDNLEFAVRFAGSVYSNSVTLSRPSAGETATTTPPTTSTPTVEVDTSTPVLTVERTLNAAGNKFVIRLAWETSRDDLIFNQHIYIRELGESNWGGYISFGNEAATSLTQDESHYWSSRLERGDTDPFEVAVGFRVVGDTSRAVIYSNPVTLYAPVVPSRPTSVTTTLRGGPLESYIDLSWNGNEGDETITGYRIWRGSDIVAENTGTRTREFRDDFSQPSDAIYHIIAISPVGVSERASSLAASRKSERMIPAPTNMTAAANGRFPGEEPSVTITWNAPVSNYFSPPLSESHPDTAISGYSIMRRKSGESYTNASVIVENTGSTALAYADTTVEADVEYFYRVAARNVHGVGLVAESSGVTVNSSATWAPPQAPGNMSAQQGSGGVMSVALSWSAPEPHTSVTNYPADSGVTGYRALRRVFGSGDEYVLFMETSDTSTTLQITLTREDQGVNYEYAVSAVNPTGAGAASSGVQYTLSLPPSAPRNLDEAIMLVWAADADPLVTGYQILRRVKDSGDDYSVLVQNTGNANQYYVDASASYGITYEYIVKAISSVGVSPASNSITGIRIGAARPDAPTNLTGAYVSGSVVLNWNAPTDNSVTGYKILRRVLNPSATPLAVLVADTGDLNTTYTDTSVNQRYKYAYRVVALSPNGQSDMSYFVNVRTR